MRYKETPNQYTRELKLERRTALALLMILTILFAVLIVAAYAAESSMPGDALYSVKSSVENTRLRLAINAIAEGEIHLQLAERRLDELSAMISRGEYDQVGSMAAEFEKHVQKAIESYQAGSSGDPIKAQELALKTAAALTRYSQTLAALHANAPEEARPALSQAMLSAQEKVTERIVVNTEINFRGFVEGTTAAAWTVAGRTVSLVSETQVSGSFQVGDPVEVRAMVSPDGSLTALSIQPAPGIAPQEEVEINGTVDAMEARSITIDSLVVFLTSQTRIKGEIQMGSRVKVQALQDPDGNLVSVVIELDERGGESTSTPRPTTRPRTATPTPGLASPTTPPDSTTEPPPPATEPPGSTTEPVTPTPADTLPPPEPTVEQPTATIFPR